MRAARINARRKGGALSSAPDPCCRQGKASPASGSGSKFASINACVYVDATDGRPKLVVQHPDNGPRGFLRVAHDVDHLIFEALDRVFGRPR